MVSERLNQTYFNSTSRYVKDNHAWTWLKDTRCLFIVILTIQKVRLFPKWIKVCFIFELFAVRRQYLCTDAVCRSYGQTRWPIFKKLKNEGSLYKRGITKGIRDFFKQSFKMISAYFDTATSIFNWLYFKSTVAHPEKIYDSTRRVIWMIFLTFYVTNSSCKFDVLPIPVSSKLCE